jgi:hypothetical protein
VDSSQFEGNCALWMGRSSVCPSTRSRLGARASTGARPASTDCALPVSSACASEKRIALFIRMTSRSDALSIAIESPRPLSFTNCSTCFTVSMSWSSRLLTWLSGFFSPSTASIRIEKMRSCVMRSA